MARELVANQFSNAHNFALSGALPKPAAFCRSFASSFAALYYFPLDA